MFDVYFYFLINIIPLYYTIKLIFLIWMFLPNFHGSIDVYEIVIFPLFKKYEKKLDKEVKYIIKKGRKLKDKAIGTFEKGAKDLSKKLKKL